MANEPIPVTPTPAPVPAPAPVVEAVQAAPVVEATPVTPVVDTAPAPVVEAAKPETVLAEAIDKSKPAEVAPKEGDKPEVKAETKTPEGQSADPAPPPVYDAFTAPEGVTLDSERIGKFTAILSELETTGKVDHSVVQQFGQKAVDFHVAEIKNVAETLTKFYKDSWDKQKIDWKDSFLKDPEIGGNRFQTTVDSALTFIRTHGGTAEQQTEFRDLMETSGLGNHPAVIRLLANAGRAMAEGKPLAASKPVPATKSKTETMYGKSA